MNIKVDPEISVLPEHWVSALRDRGFVPEAGVYARGALRLEIGARWLAFRCSALPMHVPVAVLGAPGLWSRMEEGGQAVFDLPRSVLQEEDDASGSAVSSPFDACLEWVLAGAAGEVPAGWEAPSETTVRTWGTDIALTLQQGALLRQGELILSPSRWAVRFPIASLPVELPSAREYHLGELLRDARSCWRMVRLEMAQLETERALLCEVDLSGAPHSQNLFLAGLEAARQAVLWLAEPVELVADVSLALQSFELCCGTANPTERKV